MEVIIIITSCTLHTMRRRTALFLNAVACENVVVAVVVGSVLRTYFDTSFSSSSSEFTAYIFPWWCSCRYYEQRKTEREGINHNQLRRLTAVAHTNTQAGKRQRRQLRGGGGGAAAANEEHIWPYSLFLFEHTVVVVSSLRANSAAVRSRIRET